MTPLVRILAVVLLVAVLAPALAAAIVPLVLRTLYLGLKRVDVRHRRIARWTFPLWMYVDVTGVVIYAMLYHLYPHGSIRVR